MHACMHKYIVVIYYCFNKYSKTWRVKTIINICLVFVGQEFRSSLTIWFWLRSHWGYSQHISQGHSPLKVDRGQRILLQSGWLTWLVSCAVCWGTAVPHHMDLCTSWMPSAQGTWLSPARTLWDSKVEWQSLLGLDLEVTQHSYFSHILLVESESLNVINDPHLKEVKFLSMFSRKEYKMIRGHIWTTTRDYVRILKQLSLVKTILKLRVSELSLISMNKHRSAFEGQKFHLE